MKIRKVVIPAAGLGTRFLPATKAQPKEMLPIVDKPTIQYIVEEAVASGIESIIIITGKSKRAIEDHFDSSVELETELEKKHKTELLKVSQDISNMVNLYYVRQKHPLGLGHAVLCAKDFIGNEPFGVMLGDDIMVSEKPVLKQLIEEYERQNATVVGVKQVAHDEVNKYGVIKTLSDSGKLHKIEDLVRKAADCRGSVQSGGYGSVCDFSEHFSHAGKNRRRSGRRNTAYGCPAAAVDE